MMHHLLRMPVVNIILLIVLGAGLGTGSSATTLLAIIGLVGYPILYEKWATDAIQNLPPPPEPVVYDNRMVGFMEAVRLYESGMQITIPHGQDPEYPTKVLVGKWVPDPLDPKDHLTFHEIGIYSHTKGMRYFNVQRRPRGAPAEATRK